jgi:hypothetical protein
MIGLSVEPSRLEVFRDTDYPAMIFCILGVAGLTAALGEGQTLNWFDSGAINGLFVIAVVSLAAFVINELGRVVAPTGDRHGDAGTFDGRDPGSAAHTNHSARNAAGLGP